MQTSQYSMRSDTLVSVSRKRLSWLTMAAVFGVGPVFAQAPGWRGWPPSNSASDNFAQAASDMAI